MISGAFRERERRDFGGAPNRAPGRARPTAPADRGTPPGQREPVNGLPMRRNGSCVRSSVLNTSVDISHVVLAPVAALAFGVVPWPGS